MYESLGMIKQSPLKNRLIGGLSTSLDTVVHYTRPKHTHSHTKRHFHRRHDISPQREVPADETPKAEEKADSKPLVQPPDSKASNVSSDSESAEGDEEGEDNTEEDDTQQFLTTGAALGHEDALAKSLEALSSEFMKFVEASNDDEDDEALRDLEEAQLGMLEEQKKQEEQKALEEQKIEKEVEKHAEIHNSSIETLAAAHYERMQEELRDERHKYFGPAAFQDFQEKFRSAARDLDRYPRDADLPAELRTPRSLYLRSVTRKKLLPLPLILRDDEHPYSLNLHARGLGDLRMMPVIDVLESLPAIHTIDLSDNRLTDMTLMPLAAKLPAMHTLTYLDLSFNKMDDSSATIMTYLKDERCQLRTLLLNGADVDDDECGNLCAAMAHNRSVRTLGLAKNLIGKAELMNVVNPDLVTGGEALGEMLKDNRTLTKLDLSWNAIRLESAIALAVSLETNQTLKTLLLAYNSFGDMPSQVLGRALKLNKGLTELDLESNAINPKAATVLANAISFNETLIKLNINGNTLGKIGAQALVAAIQRSSTESRKLQVSFINCDCIADDHNVFSAANPHGTWRLNLREPYGQMVAAECLYLANVKVGCRILRLLYNGQLVVLERSYVAKEEEGEEGRQKKFKLEEFYRTSRLTADALLSGNYDEASVQCDLLLRQFGFKMDEEQRHVVLKKTAELWAIKAKREGRDDLQEVILYELFFALFVINDTDLSGTMELDEFLETLGSLGRGDLEADQVKKLMNEYDRDESGSIDANEFGTIMINEFCRTEIPRGELVDASTGRPWEIPPTGHCVIQLSYQCDVPTLYDIGADHGIDNIIQSIRDAKTDDQREILFQNTTSSPYFFLSFDQAQLLYEEMSGLNRLPLELMASILPQIVNEEQAVRFIDTNLDDAGKLALRVKLGPLYGAFVGLSTGHYALDLRVNYMRNGGRRLGAICVTEGKICRQAGMTTSQKGNYSNFRNEKLGVTSVDITGRWFAMATASQSNKTLRFDYVSTTKPRKPTQPMSDARFERLLQQVGIEEVREVWMRIQAQDAAYMESLREQQEQSDMMEVLVVHDANEGERDGEDEEDAAEVRRPDLKPSEMLQEDEFLASLSFQEDEAENSDKFLRPPGSSTSAPPHSSQLHALFRNNNSSRAGSKRGLFTRDNSATLSTSSNTPPLSRLSSASFANILKKESSDLRKGALYRDLSRMPSVLQSQKGLAIEFKDYPELVMDPPLSFVQVREAYCEFIDTSHYYWDILPEERMRDVSRASYNPNERPPTPEDLRSPSPAPSRNQVHAIFPLAYKKILQLQILFPHLYLSIAQLKQLLECFPPDESLLRVLLITSVFSHITDMENMHILLDQTLTLTERNELFHRVGLMNVLDPMRPDRIYRLDLRRYDHREWTKILIQLAIAEPGDNWEGVEYRWGKYDDPVPGWSLPATWCYADDGGITGGPRSYGWLRLSYRSYGNGCMPVMAVRKFLRKRTLAGLKRLI